MRFIGLASLLTISSLSAAFADEEVVLQLPPSAALQQQNPAPDPPVIRSAARTSNPAANVPTAPNRQGRVIRPNGEKVVGRLGLTNQPTVIQASRSSRGRTLARVANGTYIALTGEKGSWYGVLMADRSVGWIPKAAVAVLQYEVVAANQPVDRHHYSGQPAPGPGEQLLNAGQQQILREAYRYLGVPYKWGGNTAGGLDCSAFVRNCFATMGIQLPRTAREQINCGIPVQPEELQAADRLYFASRDGRITHTGIYIGDGYFIHSSSSRGGVAVSRLNEPMYRRMFAGARR